MLGSLKATWLLLRISCSNLYIWPPNRLFSTIARFYFPYYYQDFWLWLMFDFASFFSTVIVILVSRSYSVPKLLKTRCVSTNCCSFTTGFRTVSERFQNGFRTGWILNCFCSVFFKDFGDITDLWLWRWVGRGILFMRTKKIECLWPWTQPKWKNLVKR